MADQSRSSVSRRTFMSAAASTAAAFTIVPSRVFGKDAPSNKLNIAVIGIGGRGNVDLAGVRGENIVALCDVDMERAADNIRKNPRAKVFRDFRVMFDKMEKDIDAVVVATPDHTHYVAAMAAMQRGKHVYCEKPLAHSVYETRKMTEAAKKYDVRTQMGNQGHSYEHIRLCCEWIWDGAIGEVREVHAWSDRPMGGFAFPSGLPRPKDRPPIPDKLDWDLWLGPAQYRPYHPLYAPIYWRGWLDFGTGALGDMGCHILDPSFWALKLGSPVSVEANVSYNPSPEFWSSCMAAGGNPKEEIPAYLDLLRKETFPVASIVRYEFPAREGMPPVKLTWYDGSLLPPRPIEHLEDRELGTNGALIIGDKGIIKHGSHGAKGCRIIPESAMQAYLPNLPEKTIPRIESHHQDWIDACKSGKESSANFDYGGALTEMVLLGVIAMRVPDQKLIWDANKMQFTNSNEANALLKPNYRAGWVL